MAGEPDLDHIVPHAASAIAIVGALIGWLPSIAALVGIIWYGLQIWESKTVQTLMWKLGWISPPPNDLS